VIQEKDVERIVATGYGRKSIQFADTAVSEITAHAKGVRYLFPEVRGIIDIGGQDSKVIAVDNGRVADFLMNDKCAAGTGKFLEYTAKALEVSIEALSILALASKTPASISSTCTVFAESEVISLRARRATKEDLAAGLVESIAQRVSVMAKQVGLKENIAFVGGVAKNAGMKAALERELGITLFVPFEPQITGALGGSLYRQT
jgi:predicted CoA-substrate-specific enzyme activase